MQTIFSPKHNVSKRYKLDPWFFAVHTKIAKYVGKNKRVLDVGCATGYLSKKFREKGCYVVVVEKDEDAGFLARQNCDEVIIGDIEGMKPYPNEFFDVIVCADILEHLKRPDLVLLKLRRRLSKQGFLIASLPNIAYFTVGLRLLLGKFEYEEIGILDLSHLRFFALSGAKRMFKICGYRVCKIDYAGLGSVLRIFPRLFAFEFIKGSLFDGKSLFP